MYLFWLCFLPLPITATEQIIFDQNAPSTPQTRKVASPNASVTLTFDDVPKPIAGLGSLPTPYPASGSPISLQFDGFSVFQPDHPDLQCIVSPDDYNCAASSPNALIGSMHSPQNNSLIRAASFELYNHSMTHASSHDHNPESFELVSLKIKPMIFPPPRETIISIRGHQSRTIDFARSAEAELAVDYGFPAGFHDMILLDLSRASRGRKWDALWKVEIWATYGGDEENAYPGLDWEFCIDDLVLAY